MSRTAPAMAIGMIQVLPTPQMALSIRNDWFVRIRRYNQWSRELMLQYEFDTGSGFATHATSDAEPTSTIALTLLLASPLAAQGEIRGHRAQHPPAGEDHRPCISTADS